MRARGRGNIASLLLSVAVGGAPPRALLGRKVRGVGFAEALSAEVAKDGIRVLTVTPGLMRTGSHLHAHFRGNHERELAWFGASAIAPLLSIDANRAARYIVRAIARGDRFLMFTPAAHVGAWLHDVVPELWSLIMASSGATTKHRSLFYSRAKKAPS